MLRRKPAAAIAAMAAMAVISIMSGLPRDAAAQDPVIGVDGCAILAILVYTEVTHAGLQGGAGELGTWPRPGEITICNQTARRITTAYSSALRQMNIYVSWGNPPMDSGDYCLSHDLDQCYPDRNPYMPPLSATDRAFVAESWAAVTRAVSANMQAGAFSDVVRFERKTLQRQLRFTLAEAARRKAGGTPVRIDGSY